jgi:putative colanic acid biosynthesis glycosyltransferase
MPVFSIVTITKDDPLGFEKTKQSVECQSFEDFEWIVVDGLIEPDNGIYDAMNKGINRAMGDYIVFMNSGDEFLNKNILQIVKDNCECNCLMYGDATEVGFLKARHNIAQGLITHHQAIYYKRTVIGDTRYDENYPIAADYKFTAQILKRAKSVRYIPQSLCIFEVGGISSKYAMKGRQEQIAIRRELGLRAPFTPYRQMLASLIKSCSKPLYFKIKALMAE